ncbi:MAG: hypothetical protein QM759_07220 [Terricaulis sp.]
MPKIRDFLELPDKLRNAAYIAIASQMVIIVLQLIVIILLIARPPH